MAVEFARLSTLLHATATLSARTGAVARDVLQHTIDEFTARLCQKTGLSFDFLTEIGNDVIRDTVDDTSCDKAIDRCLGRKPDGSRCNKRVALEYCERHRHQKIRIETRTRRAHVYASTRRDVASTRDREESVDIVPHARFFFTYQ